MVSNYFVLGTTCAEGDVRLVGENTNSTTGRIEVCLSNAWGTVCDWHFDDVDAQVACRQLGLPHTSTYIVLRSKLSSCVLRAKSLIPALNIRSSVGVILYSLQLAKYRKTSGRASHNQAFICTYCWVIRTPDLEGNWLKRSP